MPLCPFKACYSAHKSIMRTLLGNVPVFLALFLLFGGAGAGAAYWLETGRNVFLPKNWGVVETGLIYRSGQIHGDIVEDVLRDNHILLVIDLSGDAGRSHEAEQLEAVERLGIEKFDVEGLQGDGIGPITSYAKAFCRLVEARRTGRPTLVHCRAGSERTGTLFQIYRVFVHGWTPEEAYAEYVSYRRKPPKSTRNMDWLNANLDHFVTLVCQDGAIADPSGPLPRFGP